MRRIPHVQTAADREQIAKWGYSWSNRSDYVASNMLCFRVYGTAVHGGGGVKLTENSRKPLTEFVDDVIDLVRLGTQRALDSQERRRQMEEERARAAETARLIAERRAHYERWEGVLDSQFETWERANRLRAFLDAMEARGAEGASDYIAWARALVDHFDPAATAMIPEGDVPDWPHEERFRLGRPPAHGSPTYRGW